MPAKTYSIFNGAAPTTAAPVAQPTGTAIRTMMQLAPAAGFPMRVIEWNCSFDGSAAATPGKVELFWTTVAATGQNAYAAADIMRYGDPNAPANTAGASGAPFNLSTSLSGYATGAVTEGTVANYRAVDAQQIAPTNQYIKQFPLSRESEGNGTATVEFLRVRVTFVTTVNMLIQVVVEF